MTYLTLLLCIKYSCGVIYNVDGRAKRFLNEASFLHKLLLRNVLIILSFLHCFHYAL